MNTEQFWQNAKGPFLEEVKAAQGHDKVLALYRRLLEDMKTNAMGAFPHEDVLRQQIALLFKEASEGAGILLARGQPYLASASGASAPAKRLRGLLASILRNPYLLDAILVVGIILSLLTSLSAWRVAVVFAVALGVSLLRQRTAPAAEQAVMEAKEDLRIDYLSSFITQQAQRLDAHIGDLQALLLDATSPATDAALDADALLLCQYVWGLANGVYPAEATQHAAEKLLVRNGLQWIDYRPDRRGYFDVMPTRKAARTVLPAICKSDDSLVRKGQYIEPEGGERA